MSSVSIPLKAEPTPIIDAPALMAARQSSAVDRPPQPMMGLSVIVLSARIHLRAVGRTPLPDMPPMPLLSTRVSVTFCVAGSHCIDGTEPVRPASRAARPMSSMRSTLGVSFGITGNNGCFDRAHDRLNHFRVLAHRHAVALSVRAREVELQTVSAGAKIFATSTNSSILPPKIETRRKRSREWSVIRTFSSLFGTRVGGPTALTKQPAHTGCRTTITCAGTGPTLLVVITPISGRSSKIR